MCSVVKREKKEKKKPKRHQERGVMDGFVIEYERSNAKDRKLAFGNGQHNAWLQMFSAAVVFCSRVRPATAMHLFSHAPARSSAPL
jgi:hypothetical protein